jgi:cytochrome P450
MHATVDFNHADPAVSPSLFDWGQRLRTESPIAFSTAHGGFWVATRYDDITSILRNNETFICSQRITLPPQNSPVPVVPLESDEPNHVFYRSVLSPFLTPKAVREHEPFIRRIVREALDPIVAKGAGDAMVDFAARIPTRAMAMIFGFTDDDAYRFDEGFSALVNAAGSGDVERQMAAVNGFKAFLTEKIDARRGDPSGTDFVSAMLRHEKDGRRYTEDECLGLMWSAAGGAIDTTKLAIGHMIHAFGVRRDLRQRVIENPTLVPAAVEESLRMNAPAFMTARYVARDVTIGGVQMKAGQRVLLVHGWGNRDDKTFPDADNMSLDRGPNRHLTFGWGIHQCAGLHLARFELRVVLEELLARAPNYELADPDAAPILHGGMMWGFDNLPIRIPRSA